jgi:hypothetical protein
MPHDVTEKHPPHIRQAPKRAISIIGEQQRAVFGLSNANWPAPNLSVIDYEAGKKIFLYSGEYSIFHNAAKLRHTVMRWRNC